MERSLTSLIRDMMKKHPNDDPATLTARLIDQLRASDDVFDLIRPALANYVATERGRFARTIERDAFATRQAERRQQLEILEPVVPEPTPKPVTLTPQIAAWLQQRLYVKGGYKPVPELTAEDIEWRIADLHRRREAMSLELSFLEQQLRFLRGSGTITLGAAYSRLRPSKVA